MCFKLALQLHKLVGDAATMSAAFVFIVDHVLCLCSRQVVSDKRQKKKKKKKKKKKTAKPLPLCWEVAGGKVKCEGRAAPIGWFAIIRDLVTRASCCSSIGDCVAKVFPAFDIFLILSKRLMASI